MSKHAVTGAGADAAPAELPAPSPPAPPSDPVPAAARWRNPSAALPRVRWAVQLAYLGFVLWVGWQFARFHDAVVAGGPVAVERPPAVEAFLPIAALLGLKRFLLTRYWDPVHPAGLTILVAAILTAFLARKAFCSWVCPVGTISRVLEWVGRRTLWRRRWPAVPRWLDLPLSAAKYVLLAFFLVTVFVRMPLDAIEQFLQAPYNLVADAKMLAFFRSPSATVVAVLGGLAALSLVVKHVWCRWLCPYGALLGLASGLSPLIVRRDPAACNDCRACTRACPVEIPVHTRLRVLSPECTGCVSCVAACTTPAALGLVREGRAAWPGWVVPAVALGTMLGAWAVAEAAGFWGSEVPLEAFRWAYQVMGIR